MAASKPGSACVMIDMEGRSVPKASGASSLQDAFQQYRRQAARAVKTAQAETPKSKTREECAALRAAFVEQVKSYIGTVSCRFTQNAAAPRHASAALGALQPYAQKYHEPGSPEYDSPLFLDCCGLIRQAQHDLQERFGFRLARYNQNFQFDTLPDEVPLGEAKEGDLVFYKGRYVKEGKAAQRLGIVHVEMFSPGPTGRGTVGARWNAGLVSEFPDMAFTAKAWTDVEIHIRSIEPWLRGECRPQHEGLWKNWQGPTRAGDARSVFAGAMQAQEQQGMQGAEQDSDGEKEGGGTRQ
ncbi:unnamed protein product [Symbiodinium sp. KB8]|nr:unnamed protein product [Symbiodinium sp. KB8]